MALLPAVSLLLILPVGTAVLALVLGLLAAAAGGAAAGIKLGGADLGNEMAALMGAMYGLSAAVPSLIFGLIILALF